MTTYSDRNTLTIRFFGPPAVEREGRSLLAGLAESSFKLFALLALHPNRELTRQWVADTLGAHCQNPRESLRQALRRLNKALGEDRSPLQVKGLIFRLELTDEQFDVLRFDRLIRSSEIGALESAVALYSGGLLKGYEDDWIRAERKIRRERFVRAVETLALNSLTEGDRSAAARFLGLLTEVEPQNVANWRRRMEAVEAHAVAEVYHEYRSYLQSCSPLEKPDPELTAFAEKRRPPRRRASRERPSFTVPGPPPFAPPPSPRTPLIGREEVCAQTVSLMRNERLITLTGPGGVGKTRLALEAAMQAGDSFHGGVCWIELAPVMDPGLLLSTVAAALGVKEPGGKPLTSGVIISALTGIRALLALDNAEHLLAAAREFVSDLLRGCPEIHLLVTSRRPLKMLGEKVVRIRPLEGPDPDCLPAARQAREGQLMAEPATRLFVERAAAVNDRFALTFENAPAIARIVAMLDGVPLAIELAAARMRSCSPDQIATALKDRLRPLRAGDPTGPKRHLSMKATIAWSYDLLDPPEQALLRRLSVFPGGWTRDALRAAQDEKETWDPLATLRALQENSLVELTRSGRPQRYRMLETIRQYAQRKLREAGEEERVCLRRGSWLLSLAEATEGRMASELVPMLDRLEAEHDNFRAALDWRSDTAEQIDSRPRLALALARFWSLRCHMEEGRRRLAEALAQADPRDVRLQALLLDASGLLAYNQGDFSEARRFQEESLPRWRALDDAHGTVKALNRLGVSSGQLGDYRAAQAIYAEALTLAREAGDERGVIETLLNLIDIACFMGEYSRARALYQEARQSTERLEDPWVHAFLPQLAGLIAHGCGDYAEARRQFELRLDQMRAIGDRRSCVMSLNCLAVLEVDDARWDRAASLIEESIVLCREIGFESGYADVRNVQSRLALHVGDLPEALDRHQEAQEIIRSLGGWGMLPGILLNGIGILCGLGAYEEAREPLRECLALIRRLGSMPLEARTLEMTALWAWETGSLERAVWYFEQARRLRKRIGCPLPGHEKKRWARRRWILRGALGVRDWHAARRRDVSTEQALDEALAWIETGLKTIDRGS